MKTESRSLFHQALVSGFLILMASEAYASDRGVYVGASAGQTHFDISGEFIPNSISGAGSAKDTDTGWAVAVGYRFNPYIGIEAEYSDLGRASFYKFLQRPTTLISRTRTTDETSGTVEVTGTALAVVGSLPIGDWGLFGKLGGYRASTDLDAELTHTSTPIPISSIVSPSTSTVTLLSESTDSFEIMIGLGVSYTMGNHYVLSAEWTQIVGAGNESETGEIDIGFVRLGFAYRF